MFYRTAKQLDRLAASPRCDQCGAAGEETTSSYNRHYRSGRHMPPGSHCCPHCYKHFRNPAALKLHVEELHDGVFGEE